jgi:hypothetical protein
MSKRLHETGMVPADVHHGSISLVPGDRAGGLEVKLIDTTAWGCRRGPREVEATGHRALSRKEVRRMYKSPKRAREHGPAAPSTDQPLRARTSRSLLCVREQGILRVLLGIGCGSAQLGVTRTASLVTRPHLIATTSMVRLHGLRKSVKVEVWSWCVYQCSLSGLDSF